MKITETVKSLAEFQATVSRIREDWGVKSKKELWFRGEASDYKASKLRPELYRKPEDVALKSPQDLLEIEDELFERFEHCSTELLEHEVDGDDPWINYFLMQHHGGPTRLLDWSDGSLIALHFAIRKFYPKTEDRNRYVFVLDPYWLLEHLNGATEDYAGARKSWKDYCDTHPSKELDEDDWDMIYLPDRYGHDELPIPSLPLVLEFDHFERRISAQRSRFVLFGTCPDFFSELLTHADARIATIEISKESLAILRVELRDAGVTESTIFPDLDGLGGELKQLWEERRRDPS